MSGSPSQQPHEAVRSARFFLRRPHCQPRLRTQRRLQIVKSGWIEAKGKAKGRWKMKYFVLRRRVLAYGRNESFVRPFNILAISHAHRSINAFRSRLAAEGREPYGSRPATSPYALRKSVPTLWYVPKVWLPLVREATAAAAYGCLRTGPQSGRPKVPIILQE